MHKVTVIGCSMVVAALVSSPSVADTIYTIDVGLVHSKADTQFGFGGTPNPPATTISDNYSSVGNRIGFGISLSGLAGFEVGWTRFGTDSATADMGVLCPGSCPPGTPPNIEEIRLSGSAFWLAYTPTSRRDEWSLLGKLGIARVTNESKSVVTPDARIQRTFNEPLAGVGIIYHFRENLGLRFDLDWMGGNATTFGMGINFRF